MGLHHGAEIAKSEAPAAATNLASDMDISETNGFSVEFEAAVLSPASGRDPPTRTNRIGWLLKGREVESASVRYRCFHFARVLAPEFESLFFTSAGEIQERLTELDAVVIVKRIDKSVPALVAKAHFFGVPVFLDLCDDMLAPGYVKNEYGVNLVRFLGIAPMLAGVTVSSAEMADTVKRYAGDHGYDDLSVHVIPDIAETWDIYRATAKFATGADLPRKIKAPSRNESAGLKKVVWFGNYGASHSNFGIFSLKPSLKSLKAVNESIPLELVIVSNSESVYRALVRDCGFPTRYVGWSPSAVYAELALADVALLTTGDDEFCEIKSSCRVLQAFAAGVPVITSKASAVAEFEDAIALGRMQDALRNCLGPTRAQFVPPRLEAARRMLSRYTPEQLGGIWSRLLKAAIARKKQTPRGVGGKVLILVEPGDNRGLVTKLLSTAKRTPGLDYTTLVSTDLLEEHPEFGPALRLSRSIPRFFSRELEGGRNLLIGCSTLIVERPSAPVASMLRRYARELDVPVVTSKEAMERGLGALGRTPDAVSQGRPQVRSVPYQEGLNPDGSVDWAFVVHEKGRGWILDAICREIGSRQPASWRVFYYPEPIPRAKNLFFSHYAVFQPVIDENPEILENSNVFVWYTHPREETPAGIAKLLLSLEKATKIIFACESNRQAWIERGLAEEKTAVVLGAADPALFRFHERGGGIVGLSSSFYERKNPDCLLKLVKLLPHRDFLLLGRRWNQYALFEELRALPNFTYKSAPYRDYPEIYAQFDVFLSMSTLEGGPIPLMEAMMSNAVPVASRTGFAPDLIRHGKNGYIFDLDAPAEEIAEMIEAAFQSKENVRETVEQYSWNRFSAEIVKLAR
jgi:glycosyltransferase involved in cell wall biosynthesis